MDHKKKLTIYEYSKCGTCRLAVKDLEQAGRELERLPIREQPPTADELAELVKRSGLPLKKFFNTSGEVYKELGLKDKLGGMSEREQLELLASNGMLLKRPIVTDGSRATVGYKPDDYKAVWHHE